jgi:hypothetical protein
MLCDHQLVIDHINDFIEDKLSAELKQQVSACIEQCEDCQATYRQCLQLYQMSHEWQQQDVPEWHRTRYAVRPPVKQNSWLNWASMATSSLAILMVIFQLEINSGEQGLTISFGGNQTESKIEKLVEQRLASYQQEQEKLFAVKLNTALEHQDNRTKLRLANWIEKNRDERQQDIKFVMTGWQSQRYEDLKTAEQRFAYIADIQIENNQAINQLIQSVDINDKQLPSNDMSGKDM